MTHTFRQWSMKTVMALSIGLGAWTSSEAQSLTWLGVLPNTIGSYGYDVSSDGTLVVGYAYNVSGQRRAFRWTAQTGMQDLGTLGGNWSSAHGVSSDGSVVVGLAYSPAEGRAFRWTAQTGMQDILPGVAFDVSSDGTVVVGMATNNSGLPRAFRWTAQAGMQDLGTLGGDWSEAHGVSADSAVVVGYARNASGEWRAFRWVAGQGMQDLGTLPGGVVSLAYGVSANGAVVVGMAGNAGGQRRAFRWTAQTGMQDLGTLGGNWSEAYGVSADGTVVVGYAQDASNRPRAFRWTAQTGMQNLNQTYASLLTNGSVLDEPRAVSPDGRYIVGRGYNAATGRIEAFLLDTNCATYHPADINRDGVIDDADLLEVLFNFGWQRCP